MVHMEEAGATGAYAPLIELLAAPFRATVIRLLPDAAVSQDLSTGRWLPYSLTRSGADDRLVLAVTRGRAPCSSRDCAAEPLDRSSTRRDDDDRARVAGRRARRRRRVAVGSASLTLRR